MSLWNSTDQVLLVILDGFGMNPNSPKNAIIKAKTPHIDKFFKENPYNEIEASGVEVGLPKGVMGNSEVGHLNLGAGSPVRQDLVRINEAIEQDTLGSMPRMQELISQAKNNSKRIHLLGLFSDGGVHSHNDHLKKIISILSKDSELKIYLHAFMDGRDTKPQSGESFVKDFENVDGFEWGSIQGRSIGMDRDRRWEKTKQAYETLIGQGQQVSKSPLEYLQEEYSNENYDEFVTPNLFSKEAAIRKDDCVFFFNFRPDRAKQISLAFNQKDFSHFDTPVKPSFWLCMSPYFEPEEITLPILFDKEKIKNGLSEYLSTLGKKQFKIAETEKYAHVTYFFNGGEEKPFTGEEHFLIDSPKDVATYDQKPEMSAFEVCEKLSEKLSNKDISFFAVNFANSDMVGHTGNYDAAVKAIEALDSCVGKLLDKCQKENIPLLLTADHGNSDQMVHDDGTPHTAHTKAPVPVCLFHPSLKNIKTNAGDFALKDIAPTILHILGIKNPDNFTGTSIFS